MMEQWEETLQSQDLSATYATKRIIKQEEVSYLPLSLQYTVEKESKTFEQVANAEKDRVSFEVNGDVLAGFTAGELQGKNILLSFQPASAADQAIYDSYSSIFDIPAYAVYMKPVLLIDNEVVAEGDSYLESTLGTKGSFTINLTSGGRNTSVTNDVTTGSMYAVTLDSQSITAEELQSVYDEAAALRDSVAEANVYSEEYLGKLLSLAGKLYFAQVDIADTMAADMYDVAVTRSLSEGITGYEVRTSSMYGRITSLSEGNLYIDVDTDSHGVVSLNGEENVTREYMLSTGMMSSLYESAVWEELTGYESVSTISILAKAQEQNIDILLISSINLGTEIEKLNTDEATRQSVINAVNSGLIVTIPAEEIAIGAWHGTGYIVTNPATGAGGYIISGGLNGGSTTGKVTLAYLVDVGLSLVDVVQAVSLIILAFGALSAGAGFIGGAFLVIGSIAYVCALASCIQYTQLMIAYLEGDEEAGQELIKDEILNLLVTLLFITVGAIAKPLIQTVLKNKLVREFGEEFIEKMLRGMDLTDLGKYVKQLRNMNLSDDLIKEFAEKYGKEGLEWLTKKKSLGLTDDLIRKLLQADDLTKFTDDVLRVLKNSDGYADDIIEQIIKHGDVAADAIGKYGDDAAKVIKDYGDDAIDGFKEGKTPTEIIKDNFISRIEKYRNKMPTTALKKEGNMAIADVKIQGLKTEYVAHSKIDSASDIGANKGDFSYLKSENERIFTTYVEVNYPRYHDTEAKILEDIASQIKDSNISGTINMYSELPCCQSCSNIILEFRRMFPNIKLNVYVE